MPMWFVIVLANYALFVFLAALLLRTAWRFKDLQAAKTAGVVLAGGTLAMLASIYVGGHP